MVPLFDTTRQYQSLKEDLDAAVLNLLASGQYVLGPAVDAFEAAAAKAIGVKHAIGVANGTDALEIALRAIGFQEGDEVITTPFSFIATAEVVADLGGVPIFVDIEPDTFNIDPTKIEAAITEKTRAIVPVHLFGQPAAMDEIKVIAAKHGLAVVEDTAQAWGASYKGQMCGAIGDAGTFSFFPTKNLGAAGEGGLITTNRDDVAEMSKMLRVHGQKRRYIHDEIGYNSRLHSLQAAILNVKLPHADAWNQARRKNAALYAELLAGTPYIVPVEIPDSLHVYHQYTLRLPASIDRDKVTAALTAAKIGWAIYYPVPLHRQPVFEKLGYAVPHLPNTDQAAAEVLSLPIFPELREEEVREVAAVLRAAL